MDIYTSTKAMPYVYMLTHKTTNEFYYGFRCANTTSKNPKESHLDLPIYKTSSKQIKSRFHEFNWTILAEFFDAEAAYDFEQFCIWSRWKEDGMLNQTCYHGKLKFFTGGGVRSIEEISSIKLGISLRTQEAKELTRIKYAETISKKTIEEIEIWRSRQVLSSNITKSNRTDEQMQNTANKFNATLNARTDEEKEISYNKRIATLNNKTIEEKDASIKKLRITLSKLTDVEKLIKSDNLSNGHINRTQEAKELTKVKTAKTMSNKSTEEKADTYQKWKTSFDNNTIEEKEVTYQKWKSAFDNKSIEDKEATYQKWLKSKNMDIIICGIRYPSMRQASKILGISVTSVKRLIIQ